MAKSQEALVPVSGATLYSLEVERRRNTCRRRVVSTGCAEIDNAVLLSGGFERGCVVGVSAEEVDFGLLLNVQTIARSLVFGHSPDKPTAVTALIITTLSVAAILPMLRDAIRSQVQSKLGTRDPAAVQKELRRCLEATSISHIFDVEGLWEVLHELQSAVQANVRHTGNVSGTGDMNHVQVSDQNKAPPPVVRHETNVNDTGVNTNEGAATSSVPNGYGNPSLLQQSLEGVASPPGPVTSLPPLRIASGLQQPVTRKAEIQDSEDEGEEGFSSSPLSSLNSVMFASTSRAGSASPSRPTGHRGLQAEQEPYAPLSVIPIPDTNTHDPDAEPRTDTGRQGQMAVSEHVPSPELAGKTETEREKVISPAMPDIVVVTHFSFLLATLFARRDKTSAHTELQQLSSHLRQLARSPESPLIMLLNTTTTSASSSFSSSYAATTTSTSSSAKSGQRSIPVDAARQQQTKPLDQTLRSIFNHPAPQQQQQQRQQTRAYHHHNNSWKRRRNKPSFGATFAQFLDLHLLCTKVPRTCEDAVELMGDGDVRYAWVVEVLLDELDALLGWGRSEEELAATTEKGKEQEKQTEREKDKDRNLPSSSSQNQHLLPPRTNREQRWGAVDVSGGIGTGTGTKGSRIVDAFPCCFR
ncbi:hypothetical protein F5Y17DRAFT_322021 [Xylariaceae sp. FL0594]|nr:hypothetical protein F5Y17DRAFT_322021 [Xylariaceae sp. FL0594]